MGSFGQDVAGAAIKGTASAIGGTIEGISYAAELQRKSDWENVTDFGQYPQAWDVYERSGYESAIEFRDKLKTGSNNNDRSTTQTNNIVSEFTSPELPSTIIADDMTDISNSLTTIDGLSIDQQNLIIDVGQNPDAYVTVQGQYAVVNEGSSYAIINTLTKQALARNISSFLDCVKTLEYILTKSESENSDLIQTSTFFDKTSTTAKLVYQKTDDEQNKLDELDLACLTKLASYFEKMPDTIRRYHKDHHASREEAEIIANYYLQTANMIKSVSNEKDLEVLLKAVENLKSKVSRYQHESYKYRWSTSLEKEVLVKLREIVDGLKK